MGETPTLMEGMRSCVFLGCIRSSYIRRQDKQLYNIIEWLYTQHQDDYHGYHEGKGLRRKRRLHHQEVLRSLVSSLLPLFSTRVIFFLISLQHMFLLTIDEYGAHTFSPWRRHKNVLLEDQYQEQTSCLPQTHQEEGERDRKRERERNKQGKEGKNVSKTRDSLLKILVSWFPVSLPVSLPSFHFFCRLLYSPLNLFVVPLGSWRQGSVS